VRLETTSPGENALRHELRRWNEDLDNVIEDAKRMAAAGIPRVRVVEVSMVDRRRVTVLWEAEPSTERRMLVCKRCGASWEPRVGRPVRCPACKTPLWDQDRVRAPGGGRKE